MEVLRLEVAGGFFDGLDLRFSRGLNVLIGARGTGKTSVIELLRYCLGIPALTELAATRGETQAVSVLAGGSVTVTVRQGAETWSIQRSASGVYEEGEPLPHAGTVLAQNEMETVGAQSAGRLQLLDSAATFDLEDGFELQQLEAKLRSDTTELSSLIEHGTRLAEQVANLAQLRDALSQAEAEQAKSLQSIDASATERSSLALLQSETRRLAQQIASYTSLASALRSGRDLLANASFARPDSLNFGEADDRERSALAPVATHVEAALLQLRAADGSLGAALSDLEQLIADNAAQRASLEANSRELRGRLERLQEGASVVTRRVAELQEQVGQLQAYEAELERYRRRFEELRDSRNLSWASVEAVRERRFRARRAAAQSLSDRLAPGIRISVTQSAVLEDYQAAVVAALRGSRLHYNALAPRLVEMLTPHELVEAAENGDVDIFARIGIAAERAASLITAIRGGASADIIASRIEDAVQFHLLDGVDYKPSEELSIGQRCTVVLPIVLANSGLVVVDQPEDHLDNRFVASYLAKSLRDRPRDRQVIISSHNANIPVLGNAHQVTALTSDGRRGRISHSGALTDPATVDAVKQIMEGGEQAFRARSLLYKMP